MRDTFPISRAYAAVLLAWVIAQSIKILNHMRKHKRFDIRWIIDTGGMPSSHSSGTAAVATVVGLFGGFDSIIFLLALFFALVTMFDAASVRRSVGKQAVILNRMIDEVHAQGTFSEQRLRAFLGHTPFEVVIGAILGTVIAYAVCVW